MVLQDEIKNAVEKSMDLMVSQTTSYIPFLKIAFPHVRDLSEFVFNMMIGNALTVFFTQFSMRMQSPSESDFADFGKIVEPYRNKIKELF